jgi:hypothetical protein
VKSSRTCGADDGLSIQGNAKSNTQAFFGLGGHELQPKLCNFERERRRVLTYSGTSVQYRDSKLLRSSTCTQEAIRHDILTLLNKVQFGPLHYPLRSHMSDLHLFIVASFSQPYAHLIVEAQTRRRPPLLYCHPLVVA